MSDAASIVDFGIDRHESEASPPILRRPHVSLPTHTAILVAADIVGVMLLGLCVFYIQASPLGYDGKHLGAGLLGFLIGWIVASLTLDLYGRRVLLSEFRSHLQHGLVACVTAFGAILLAGFAFNLIGDVARPWLLTWAVSAFVWLCGVRMLWSTWLQHSLRRGKCVDRALILSGRGGPARQLSEEVERGSRGQIAVVSAMGIPGTPGGVPMDHLDMAVRDGMVDRVIISDYSGALEQTKALVARMMRLAVDVTLIPDLAELQAPVIGADRIGMLAAIGLASRPLTAIQLALKRAEDLLLGSIAIIVALPLLLIVAIAIKIDSSGPVLFGQFREGYHNRIFKVWKFRTMHHGMRDERSVQQTSRYDRRVTRVGRILRRLSLDELPQIINVLRGEMSIVGPRPHALGMTSAGKPMAQVLEDYAARQRLKPGITGWAQVSGCRGEIDSYEKLRRRVALDCYYIDNWSLALDLWIIARTFALLLFDRDAY